MKTQRNTIILLAMICLGLFLTTHLSAQNADQGVSSNGIVRWEHMAVPRDIGTGIADAAFSRQIVQFGNDGWELVDVESVDKDGTTTKTIYFFKRRR